MRASLRFTLATGLLLGSTLASCSGDENDSFDADDATDTYGGTGGTGGSDDGNPTTGGSIGTGGSGGDSSEMPEPTTLRVATLNVWNQGLDVVADDIRDLDADVVGLQEITPSEVEEVVADLGSGWTFAQEDRANSLAIVSRYPILERVGVVPEGRGGVGVTVALGPKLRAHVFVVHLDYTPYGPYQLQAGMSVEDVVESEEDVRMPELREILDLAAPSLGSDEAAFLVGDFNAPSHLDYDPAVPWPTSVVPTEAGFVDSYAALHPDNEKKWACEFAIDDPGITWTQIADEEPNGCFDRIDFVYGSDSDAEPIESRVFDAASSDHRAVVSTFELDELTRAEAPLPSLPSEDQLGMSRHALLTWSDVRDTTRSRIFLGTGDDLEEVGETESTHFVTALLEPDTTYTFRIEAVTPNGDVTSTERSFTTRTSGGFDVTKREFSPGETITLDVDGGDSTTDWIGLHARTSAYGSGLPSLTWKYLNDSQTAPPSAVTSGTVTLTAPTDPGEYVLRFFHADGYRVEDELSIVVRSAE